MIKSRQIRRLIVPTVGLTAYGVLLLFGLVLLIIGLILSFRVVATPVVVRIAENWNTILSNLVGESSVARTNHLMGGMLIVLGIIVFSMGARGLIRRFMNVLNPSMGPDLADEFFKRQQLILGPRIVALGGGTGLSTLLRGLKAHTSRITAIVTVTDDGGSSGRLSQELGIIPPGDIRNCLVALADAEKQVTDIFQYRFKGQSGSLSGHSLGNLLIAGLVDLNGGDFERALTMASEVLAIRGRVIPSTLEQVQLKALLDNDSEVIGETKIASANCRVRRVYLEPQDCHVYPEALNAIEEAELIVVGPGSVYTSVIPNLLVPGVADAIRKSKALKVYVCNVMTQPGESDAFTACEHVLAIQASVGERIFDYVLLNTQLPSHDMIEKYQSRDQYPVEADIDRIQSMGYKVVGGDYMNESDYVRHDPVKVATSLMRVLNK